jgi:hypothetical protein
MQTIISAENKINNHFCLFIVWFKGTGNSYSYAILIKPLFIIILNIIWINWLQKVNQC